MKVHSPHYHLGVLLTQEDMELLTGKTHKAALYKQAQYSEFLYSDVTEFLKPE